MNRAALPDNIEQLVLTGAMATISCRTINDNHGNDWPGDRSVYQLIKDAQLHLEDQPHERKSALSHAIAIIAAANAQVVAEGWGAKFQLDQAWSQSELQRMLDLN